jgi:hypothetical protein
MSNTSNPDLVGSSDEKGGESRTEGDFTPAGKTSGHADHVLLGDETFDETFRMLLEESNREGTVFSIAVQANYLRVGFSCF